MKKGAIFVAVVGLMVLQLSFMFYMNQFIVEYDTKYPVVDCNSVRQVYGTKMKDFAVVEWSHLDREDRDSGTNSQGAYLCYCNDFYKERGIMATLTNVVSASIKGKVVSGRICADLIEDIVISLCLSVTLTTSIVVMNYVLRKIIIYLVEQSGSKTWSK